MNAISAERIFKGANELFSGQSELPPDIDFAPWRGHLDLMLGEAWNSEWWQFLMRFEWRYFRALWLSTATYNQTDEVYDAASQKYYQCLRDSVTGAGNSPTDSAGDERSAYWAECKTSYQGNDWASGTAYSVGDIIYYTKDDTFYQCHTAHTSSGTLVPDATSSNERWGPLTSFERYVDYLQADKTEIGDVLQATSADPRITTTYDKYTGETIRDRYYVRDAGRRVFLTFRVRRPRLTGEVFSTSATYSVGDQVYFAATGTPGNFYECITATSAGESPASAAAKWSVIEIPEQFQGALTWGLYAKALVADERADEARAAASTAEGYLMLETDRKYRQAGETPALPMRVYP